MKRLGTLLIASFLVGAGLAISTDNVQASGLPTNEVASCYSTQIEKMYPFNVSDYPYAPPERYWYDDGRLRGYLYLEDYVLDAGNGIWIAYYYGTVYSCSAPIES